MSYTDIDGERLSVSKFANSVDGEVVTVKTRKHTLYFSISEAKRVAQSILLSAKQIEGQGIGSGP